jgi:hypothetical protein
MEFSVNYVWGFGAEFRTIFYVYGSCRFPSSTAKQSSLAKMVLYSLGMY